MYSIFIALFGISFVLGVTEALPRGRGRRIIPIVPVCPRQLPSCSIPAMPLPLPVPSDNCPSQEIIMKLTDALIDIATNTAYYAFAGDSYTMRGYESMDGSGNVDNSGSLIGVGIGGLNRLGVNAGVGNKGPVGGATGNLFNSLGNLPIIGSGSTGTGIPSRGSGNSGSGNVDNSGSLIGVGIGGNNNLGVNAGVLNQGPVGGPTGSLDKILGSLSILGSGSSGSGNPVQGSGSTGSGNVNNSGSLIGVGIGGNNNLGVDLGVLSSGVVGGATGALGNILDTIL